MSDSPCPSCESYMNHEPWCPFDATDLPTEDDPPSDAPDDKEPWVVSS